MRARTQQSLERPQPPSNTRTLVWFVLLALLLHIPLLFIPRNWLFAKVKPAQKRKRVVTIQRISRAQSKRKQLRKQRLRRLRQRVVKRKPKPKQRKKPKERKKPKKVMGQIVDVSPTPDDRPPEKTKFLSEYNTRVKKETVSRFRKLKYKVAAPKRLTKRPNNRAKKRPMLIASRIRRQRSYRPPILRPGPVKQTTTPKTKRTPKPKSTKNKRQTPKRKRQRKVALPSRNKGRYKNQKKQKKAKGQKKKFSLKLELDPSLKMKFKTAPKIPHLKLTTPKFKYRPGIRAPKSPPSRPIDLKPNFGTLSRIEGSPAPDHIKGVKEGDATYLNTRQYVYASFFNRIKQQVAQHWNPNSVYRRRDPFGNVYGVKDRATTVSVELNKNGKLSKVSVSRSSGLSFLDKEAMRAFRAAHPFPNPPKALVERDGKIRFKFNFFLQVSNRSGIRLFR